MAAADLIVKALLTGVASGRVYPVSRPQNGTLPAAVTSMVSLNADGRIGQFAGPQLYRARMQVDCYAKTYEELKDLVDAVLNAIQLKSGTYADKVVVSSLLDAVGADGLELNTGVYFQPIDFFIVFYD